MKYLQIKFEIDGLTQLNAGIKGVKDAVNDMIKPFNDIVDEFHQTQEKVFVSEGSHEGLKKWADLSEDYEVWKIVHFGNLPILTLHGNLRKSLTERNFTSDVGGSIARVSKMNLEIGTSVNYAMAHQRGTSKMPMRPPLRLTDEQKKRWIRIIRLGLSGQIERRAVQKYRAKGDSKVIATI